VGREHRFVESRRCLICNDLSDKDRRPGFMKDPNNEGQWIKCVNCNDKGFNTKTGSSKAD